MATETSKARTSLVPVFGLLALAGMACGSGPASAQLECPLPESVTPPALPRVTARQVEDGSASLTAFALASRDQAWTSTSVERAAYVGCLLG